MKRNVRHFKRIFKHILQLMVVTFSLLAAMVSPAWANTDENKIMRVAFPQTEGMSQTLDDGRHVGLLVDYLNEIAKYTNWQYDYVDTESEFVVNDFLDGKFDLIGGIYYSPGFEQYFAYPDYNMGSSKAILLCRSDDNRAKRYNLHSIDGMTIGVYDRADEKIRRLKDFLLINGIECELKYYGYDDLIDGNLYDKLINKEVDLLLGNDMECYDDLSVLTSFNAQDYYIVTDVGNQEVLDDLNMALERIIDSDPDFANEHYNLNFPERKTVNIRFNEEELEYISGRDVVSVAVVDDWHPFYCVNGPKNLHRGLIPDLIDKIAEISGLKFTYVYADSYADAIRMVQNSEADILGCFLDSEDTAITMGLALSKSYISMNNMIIKNKSVSYPGTNLVGAVVDGRDMYPGIGATEIKRYGNTLEGVVAVDRGEVDFMYGLGTCLEMEMQKHRLANVSPITSFNISSNVSLAMNRPVNPNLLSIINKSINSMSVEEKAAIYDKNIISVGYTSLSLIDVIYANPIAFAGAVMAFLILAITVVMVIARAKVKGSAMENELKRVEAESKAKGEFLSRMSHEIRTPMNAIVGLTDIICMSPGLPADIDRNLQKIRSSSKYMLSLISDILDMSRIESGMLDISEDNFSLKDMLEDIESMMRPQADKHQLTLIFDLNIRHSFVTGDELRLRQVLVNLLSNALKFTNSGGSVNLTVSESQSTQTEGEFTFSVEDTGIGIDAIDQERIFDAFEQIDSNISKSNGTGLGLPISKKIVGMMGGMLTLTSEPGGGSKFYFTIKLPTGEEMAAKSQEVKSEFNLKNIRILLAEDNDLNAEIATELLTIKGAVVERAENGQIAVDMFINHESGYYQVILMDIQMPVKNGLDAVREIRSCNHFDARRIPIIAMTANSFKEDADAATDAGMDGFIPKPVDVEYLYELLEKLLVD